MNAPGAASDQLPVSELAAILATVTDDKPASFLAAARRLAGIDLPPLRAGVLATFTFDLIVPYLVVEGARRGMRIDARVAPFGQLEQQALDAGSVLYAQDCDVVVVAARIEDAAPQLADGFLALSQDAAAAAIAEHAERLAGIARAIRERSRAHIVVWNQAPPARLPAGLADAGLAHGQQAALAALDRAIAAAVAGIPGASVFDAARIAVEVGTARFYDARLAHIARCPLSGAAQLAIGRGLARHLRAATTVPKKCLVLDLDNTLWGGVVGEDGVGGIALGEAYPGSAYKAFQRAVRSYRDRGVILAIASKNNEADVAEVFAHPDMVLGLDDFAARQIHWNDKAQSLRAIAKDLEIGVDSLVFFDDNPVERAWVREQLPEVTVIDVPTDPLRYIAALDDAGAFDHLVITAEDRARAGQYQAEGRRKSLASTATNVDDFLRALEMVVTIAAIDEASLPRVVQLLGKTNQFNVTTRRHDEPALSAMLAAGGVGLTMRIADRFGDSGLVGVALAVPDGAAAFRLDSFLMSCRVLGRRAEQSLLYALHRHLRAAGGRTLVGEFIPTKKNAPAAGFFRDTGFTETAVNHYKLDISVEPVPPAFVTLVEPS